MLTKQAIIFMVIAATIIISTVFYGLWRETKPPEIGIIVPDQEVAIATTTAPQTNNTPLQTAQSKKSGSPNQPLALKSGVSIISPSAGEKWIIGENHTIKWSKESGFKGYVYLADAETGSVVGWINSETGPHQTSYAWNARDLFLARYNPNKKTVEPGKYMIGVGFESRQAPITSGVFEVIYASQAETTIHNFIIQNYLISPEKLFVKKGDVLRFVNKDNITHRLILSGYSPFVITAGQPFDFDTNILFPGPYNFYSEGYPTANADVTVQ